MLEEAPVIVLAFAAALLYGVSGQVVRLGLGHLDVRTAVTVSSGVTALTFLLVSPLWFKWQDATNPGILIFAAFGFFHPLVSRYLAYEANRRVGATISSTFESLSPLLSVAVAIVFLRERPDAFIIAGTMLAVAGGAYIYWHPSVSRSLIRTAMLMALAAMSLRAMNNVVGKVGLDLVPNPMMAAFTAYSVSFLIAISSLKIAPPQRAIGASPRGIGWFAAVGVITAVASGCLYGALMMGEVVIVAPILASYPVFVMLIGWLLGTEPPTARNMTGVLAVVIGVALITARAI